VAKPVKLEGRSRRRRRVRKRVAGVAERPRLSVFRSLKHIYAQVVDDDAGVTLCGACSLEKAAGEAAAANGGRKAVARAVGRLLGERAVQKGVKRVVFDRAGYKYHGRVAALAEGAREAGLEF
jgi:large subunit ribosomal protein L18